MTQAERHEKLVESVAITGDCSLTEARAILALIAERLEDVTKEMVEAVSKGICRVFVQENYNPGELSDREQFIEDQAMSFDDQAKAAIRGFISASALVKGEKP